MTDFTVLEADYHRNGVGGEGFYVGLIVDHTNDDRRMLVTMFPRYMSDGDTLATYQDRVSVVDVDQAAAGNVYMHPHGDHRGGNAWRGSDHFQDAALAIRAAVEARWAAVSP